MKIKLLILSLLFFVTALIRIDKSYAYFFEKETVSANLSAAECFEDCGEEGGGLMMTVAGFAQEPELLFYKTISLGEVGFVLNNVYEYEAFEYVVTYEHKTEYGILEEAIIGRLENPEFKGTILEEGIFLGTETAGGTRVYHEGIETIYLKVDLIRSGVSEKTLEATLNL